MLILAAGFVMTTLPVTYTEAKVYVPEPVMVRLPVTLILGKV
jgi:hypothetical protein